MPAPAAGRGVEPRPAARRLVPIAADLALVLGLLAIALLGTGPAGRNQPGSTPVDGWCWALVGMTVATLLVRRSRPVTTLALATVTTSAYLILGYPYGPILLAYLVAVYTVAVRLPVRPAALAGLLSLAVVLTHAFWSAGRRPGLFGVLPGVAWVVLPFALGVVVRLNREATVRAQAELARQRADEERIRIAREVHDVVGHGLAAINMQAQIALHLLGKRPEQAESALAAISRTSKESLDELRVTLGVLRDGGERVDDRSPVAGLARLDALRTRLAGAGLTVSVRATGEPRQLPGAVDLAAYRVVQEALTNVLRHAGTARATVVIGYDPDAVTVTVTDPGRAGTRTGRPVAEPGPTRPVAESEPARAVAASGPARPAERDAAVGDSGPVPPTGGQGHGLAGMAERVTALGGTFTAGPHGDGFRVHARLPAGDPARLPKEGPG